MSPQWSIKTVIYHSQSKAVNWIFLLEWRWHCHFFDSLTFCDVLVFGYRESLIVSFDWIEDATNYNCICSQLAETKTIVRQRFPFLRLVLSTVFDDNTFFECYACKNCHVLFLQIQTDLCPRYANQVAVSAKILQPQKSYGLQKSGQNGPSAKAVDETLV